MKYPIDSKNFKHTSSAGKIAYTETNSYSTQPISGNFITDTECKSIEDTIAKEVLKEMRMNSKVFKTLEGPMESDYKRTKGKSKHKTDIRLMSFKDLRQLQKVASESIVGPGSYNLPIDQQNKISFGMRTHRKIERLPGPGEYNSDA